MQREKIAEVCHEVNRMYCQSQGDMTQPVWDEAPEWQKQSAITGVQFHLDNPTSKPSDSHESWLKEKQRDGWKFGAVKDPVAKTHPCFVSYEELPAFQKAKDFIFIGVVRALEKM